MLRLITFALVITGLALAQICDQPFAPVRPNWEWQYQVKGARNTTYTLHKTAITNNSFVQVRQSQSGKEEQKFGCTPEGLTPLELGGSGGGANRASIDGQAVSYDIDLVSVKGVSIADYDRWEVGETWKLTQEIRGSGQQGPIRYAVSGTLETTYKVVGQEQITVPAGKFTAFKLQTTFATRIKATAGIISIPFNFEAQGTSWFAEGIGLIKSIQQSRDGTNTTELVTLKR